MYPLTLNPSTVTVQIARAMHPAIGRNAIYAAMKNGVLQNVSVGKRRAIPVEALNAWVMNGCPTQELNQTAR